VGRVVTSSREKVPLLRVNGLSKSFPGVKALVDVDFDVRPGEVHALVGQNGAGKSTLIKVLAGAYGADAGHFEVQGQQVEMGSTADSARHGIAVIHQDLNLVKMFDVTENMTLGLPQPHWAGVLINWRALRARVRGVLESMNVDISPTASTSSLSIPQQTMVAIGRALMLDAKVVIMDEPTASLGAHGVEQVYEIVRRLRDQGCGVVYVSHRLQEVSALADRITVMRDGKRVGTFDSSEITSRSQLIRLIIGRPERELVRATHHTTGAVLLTARGLSWQGRVVDVDLDVHAGEVTGIAGLVGSGRTELAALLFGAAKPDRGDIRIDGHPLRRATPGAGIAAGVALLPEDRRGQAAFTGMSVRENLTIAALGRFAAGPFVRRGRERDAVARATNDLAIKCNGPESVMATLSGGNQQKVVIAKWLQTDAKVLIFDEPTQGVDVGAQEEIHRLVRQLAHEGRAVIFISSDLEETLRISDRVLVLREGRLVGDLRGDGVTIDEVLTRCYGTDHVPGTSIPNPLDRTEHRHEESK
jgi:ABC-type sugar transport system ATPase subunit